MPLKGQDSGVNSLISEIRLEPPGRHVKPSGRFKY